MSERQEFLLMNLPDGHQIQFAKQGDSGELKFGEACVVVRRNDGSFGWFCSLSDALALREETPMKIYICKEDFDELEEKLGLEYRIL